MQLTFLEVILKTLTIEVVEQLRAIIESYNISSTDKLLNILTIMESPKILSPYELEDVIKYAKKGSRLDDSYRWNEREGMVSLQLPTIYNAWKAQLEWIEKTKEAAELDEKKYVEEKIKEGPES